MAKYFSVAFLASVVILGLAMFASAEKQAIKPNSRKYSSETQLVILFK